MIQVLIPAIATVLVAVIAAVAAIVSRTTSRQQALLELEIQSKLEVGSLNHKRLDDLINDRIDSWVMNIRVYRFANIGLIFFLAAALCVYGAIGVHSIRDPEDAKNGLIIALPLAESMLELGTLVFTALGVLFFLAYFTAGLVFSRRNSKLRSRENTKPPPAKVNKSDEG